MPATLRTLLPIVFLAGQAHADNGPGLLCRGAITAAESELRLPDQFLSAIARVESGRPSQATGGLVPWPWTINTQGQGHYFATKAQAVQAVAAYQAMGVRSIDVGCLQVNLQQHPEAFSTLDAAFDPATNARFAARLLRALFVQTGSWPRAAAAYHSQTHTVGAAYQRLVLDEWAVPDTGSPASPASQPGQAAPAPLADLIAPTLVAHPAPNQDGPAIMGFRPAVTTPAAHAPSFTGRDLASYRLMPTRLSARLPPAG